MGANNEYNAQSIVDAFFEAAAILDEKNMPQAGRFAVLSPRQYYALVSPGRQQHPEPRRSGMLCRLVRVCTALLVSPFVSPTTCLSWLVM